MIRVIKVHADYPAIPFEPVQSFVDSSLAFVFTSVPAAMERVKLTVTAPDGAVTTVECDAGPRGWGAVVPGGGIAASGISRRGIRLTGYDVLGNTYALGFANLVVTLADGTLETVDGAVEHGEFAAVETVGEDSSMGEVKATVNELIGILKG